MRFDKWFKYGWTINLSFLCLSIAFLAFYVFAKGDPSIGSVIGNPFDVMTLIPSPILYFIILPFFISGYMILAMGILEVCTSKKDRKSKASWILAMLVFGVLVTVVYYFFRGRDQLTD